MPESRYHPDQISLFRLLSLDIVAGALSVSYYFTRFFNARVPAGFWFSLGLFVWLVYILDRLADTHLPGSYNNKAELLRLRTIRGLLTKTALIIFLLLVVSIFFLPWQTLLFGLAGTILVVLYLVLNQIQNHQQRYLVPRELMICLFYLGGTAGVPMLYARIIPHTAIFFLGGFLALLIANTLIFACVQYNEDKSHNIQSLAVVSSPSVAKWIGIGFSVFAMVCFSVLTYFSIDKIYAVLGAGIGCVYFILQVICSSKNERPISIIADCILILPLILFFF